LKKCFKCGAVWPGFGRPRPRQICENCGTYLHVCLNCHHFDHHVDHSCRLPGTTFIGARDTLNYCEKFEMVNWERQAIESRCAQAKATWENLFRR
jgi:hypothetical protein